jgi:hypothetical protein
MEKDGRRIRDEIRSRQQTCPADATGDLNDP